MKKWFRGALLTCVIAAVVAGCGKEGTSSRVGGSTNSVSRENRDPGYPSGHTRKSALKKLLTDGNQSYNILGN